MSGRPLVALVLAALVPSAVSAQVPYSRIRNADQEPETWLTYSGSYRAHRYSPLDQINAQNVGRLRVAWAYQIDKGGTLEASPLVADGVMYLTEPPSTVTALDARTGRGLWTWSPKLPKEVKHIGFPRVNRGVALLDDSVYVGTLDAHLVALDARSGAVRWDVVVADNATGHAITVAPLALDGKLIIGISGGEAGIRGFLDAYDARTGKRLWRSFTVPGTGEPGNESWAGDSWKTGGAPTWVTGAYDPELNLLYWGTGNPAPDWNGDGRAGDNLYSCSLVAFDATTGERRWHFQFTPHDVHDWDANQVPVLVDAVYGGRPRKLVVTANRNAFYYLLDRETGEFLLGTPYATQTWAERLDPRGRPVVKPGTEPTLEGTLVWPSLQGATNWFSPAFSPATGLFYVAVREMGSRYYKREAEYVPGREFNIGFVGARTLAVAEIDFTGMPEGTWPILTYAAKWHAGTPEDLGSVPVCPALISQRLADRLTRTAEAAWRVMQGKGYGRVDLRVDDTGRPWVLDVNPNPDLTDEAGLARMARAAGWAYPELVRRIAEVALREAQGHKAARELLAAPRRPRAPRTA